jgi:serine/threonine protein kinase
VKCMKKKYTNIDTVNTLREVRALKRLSTHKNIISLLDVIL